VRGATPRPDQKALTNLRLRLTDFGGAGAKEIVESGILKRLKVLDLQGGCITHEGAGRLAGCPDLKHLDYLNLSRNALTKAGEQAIAATRVKGDVSPQHGGASGEWGGGECPDYLFEGDIE
jgi:Ran GTPase-activating protein (RanGAP) involved in mRNA processing and transport